MFIVAEFFYLLLITYIIIIILPHWTECINSSSSSSSSRGGGGGGGGGPSVEKPLRISLTISAKYRLIQISWFNVQPNEGIILITDREPHGNEFKKLHLHENLPIPSFQRDTTASESSGADVVIDRNNNENNFILNTTMTNNNGFINNKTNAINNVPIIIPLNNNETTSSAAAAGDDDDDDNNITEQIETILWIYGRDNRSVIYTMIPDTSIGWHTTTIPFDYSTLKHINITTKCYGYWATYIANDEHTILYSTCISANPMWMNEMKNHIGKFKIRDLFLVGTHDSGSYRNNFNPLYNETLISKYSLTQDDDIYSQLMHGIRYLDIRIGFYRSYEPQFWINHGISRQQPLIQIIHQVKEFVQLTNEIIIFDVQEFPVGFGQQHDIHHLLIQYLHKELNEYIADPELTWDCTLNDIWKRKKLIILSYDYIPMVHQFPTILWPSVLQRWANAQNIMDLKRYLSPIGRNFMIYSKRPIADMAELTPTTWDVLTDRFNGLRNMADEVNSKVSLWYYEEWGPSANIVAVDFYRGTNLMETSLYWNTKRDILENR